MTIEERATQTVQRAESMGIRLHYDSGLVFATLPATGDTEKHDAAIEALGRYNSAVRRLLQERAVASRATGLVGQRIWFQEFGMGTLSGSDSSGSLAVTPASNSPGFSKTSRYHASAENVLVVLQDEEVASPESSSPAPRRRIFGLLL